MTSVSKQQRLRQLILMGHVNVAQRLDQGTR